VQHPFRTVVGGGVPGRRNGRRGPAVALAGRALPGSIFSGFSRGALRVRIKIKGAAQKLDESALLFVGEREGFVRRRWVAASLGHGRTRRGCTRG
jgi:hypothetical protein